MAKLSKDDKIAYILNVISLHYTDFCNQAKIKLIKHRKFCDNNSHIELISDIIYSIVVKFNDSSSVDRFYKMARANKLSLYIFKAISTNTSYFTAPFLRSKLKEFNRFTLIENINTSEHIDEDYTERLEKENAELFIVNSIQSMLKPPLSISIFGKEDWKYYTRLFNEYINTSATYQSLSDKYNIPLSSISFHIRFVKEKIRDELNKLYIKQSVN